MANFYVPRSKNELIKMIIKSGKWTGTKATLRSREKKVLYAIFHRIRNAHFIDLIKRPNIQDGYISEQTNKEDIS